MEYITTAQAAKQWGISDRRVRALCSEGKILGATKDGKSYKIPAQATKPIDGRMKTGATKSSNGRLKASIVEANDSSIEVAAAKTRYLKWGNTTIAKIAPDNTARFTHPEFNEVVRLYTNGLPIWTAEQYLEFLSERIVNRERRDIEKVLFRCGLSHFDVLKIAEITRGIHPKDLLWIAQTEDEILDDVMTDVFDAVFHKKIDLVGDSINTPEGYNIKRYGVLDGSYGIYKQRISPLHGDVESEVAAFRLATKLGVPCCPAVRVARDAAFSQFMYDFSSDYLVHFRHLFDGARSENEYQNLVEVRPQYRDEIARMIMFDFITRQDDRHLSNIAICIGSGGEHYYPLYDNGRCLFYEDTEAMVEEAVSNVKTFATTFGYSGTYWDYVQEIASERESLEGLLDLDITHDEIVSILETSGFRGFRLNGASRWIMQSIELVRDLS